MFRDRIDAAEQLARRLAAYRGTNPLILSIPRGAVPMGDVLAERLEGELDVVLIRKLRAPFNPEFALGAVDESGWSCVADYATSAGATPEYIKMEKQIQLETMARRRAQYTPVRLPISPKGRTVIVIDDGLATGATMISALHAVREKGPARLICAVPVAPPDTLEKVSRLADEVVCLDAPMAFHAVGQFYGDFPQVEDEDVVEILRKWGARKVTAH